MKENQIHIFLASNSWSFFVSKLFFLCKIAWRHWFGMKWNTSQLLANDFRNLFVMRTHFFKSIIQKARRQNFPSFFREWKGGKARPRFARAPLWGPAPLFHSPMKMKSFVFAFWIMLWKYGARQKSVWSNLPKLSVVDFISNQWRTQFCYA